MRLFYRDNRNVELTPAGCSFLEDARAILRRAEDAVRRARQTRILRTYPLLALMPGSHPLAHRTSIRRSELREYPLVDIKKNENRYGEKATIMKAFTDAGFLPHIVYTSDDIETSILAVATGIGYALLPSYITDAIPPREKVVAIPIEGEEEKMTVIGAWMAENANPALSIFLREWGNRGSV